MRDDLSRTVSFLIKTMSKNLCRDFGCPDGYVLTEETIRILEESKLGIGVQSYTSLEDLYKDLGI